MSSSPSFIPFHVPDIGEAEIQSVVETLRSGWLTTGLKAKEFEEKFAAYIGAPHAVAVNSGTAALHLALDAVGIKAGDEVIVPTTTFTATAEVVTYMGARPVLVDCQEDTFNIDPAAMERAIGPKTKAVMPVDFAGQPAELGKIREIARDRKLAVIEDAAHALPARYQGKLVGTLSDITCFSFYATKTITTGEGGMATTANQEWADHMRMMSLHGISKDAWKRYTASGSWYYEVEYPGFKYNLTDIAASLGLVQLKRADEFWKKRQRIAELYDRGFVDFREVRRPAVREGVQHAWHLYVIQLELERLRIGRNEFIEALKEQKIGTSVHFIPLHLHPFYKRAFGYQPTDFPQATAAFDRIISLPIFPKMSDSQVERVIDAVRSTVREHRR
jgi:dTDP-4-amino-4,6-dideoxygalactose transaminase